MNPLWLSRLPRRWQARLMKLGFNFHPAFRGTGGRVDHVSDDLTHVRVRLPLNWRTRNVVGSIYGGSLFAVTDGAHPTILMAALGSEVIIWDKSASIRYRRPGRSTLYADFHIPPEEIDSIRLDLDTNGETERTYPVELKDKAGHVHAVVERTVYIAKKSHYKQKVVEKKLGRAVQ
jgi:acyl-coenzyme A thioesterase PaaI-like protein